MKIKILEAGKAQMNKEGTLHEFEMKQPIPIPEGKDIYILAPDGVFRCNINDGIFPEDRYFFQGSTGDHQQHHVINYKSIAHLKNPSLSIRMHYPGTSNEDILVEFRDSSQQG